MTAEAIAQRMIKITSEFQRQMGMSDEAVDKIVHHCFRKMELTKQPAEYILLLLPDELKQECFRCAVNARSIEILSERRATQSV